jgi:hypothetical protein
MLFGMIGASALLLGVLGTWDDNKLQDALPDYDSVADKVTLGNAKKAIKMYVLLSVPLFITNSISVFYPFGSRCPASVFS